MIWFLIVMLTYTELNEPQLTKWEANTFKDKQECTLFLKTNKVILVDSLLEKFRNKNNNNLTSFEFYCKGENLEEV